MVGEIVCLRILCRKFYEGQCRGHNSNDNGWPSVALFVMAMGYMFKVFVCLLDFIAHKGGLAPPYKYQATASSHLRVGEFEPAQPECRSSGAGGSVRLKRLMRLKPPPHGGEVCALSALCAQSPRIGGFGLFDWEPEGGRPSTPGRGAAVSQPQAG